MEEFLQSMKYYCEYCAQNQVKLSNEYTELLDEMPRIHYAENAFIRPRLDIVNGIFLGCKNHYRCKDHCLICKDSSRNCALHCVKCWPNIIKLSKLEWEYELREKKISAAKMKKSKPAKQYNTQLDSIEDEFARVLKYDNASRVSYDHLHTQLDVAAYLFTNFEISKQEILAICINL